jgi:hypothetical protein
MSITVSNFPPEGYNPKKCANKISLEQQIQYAEGPLQIKGSIQQEWDWMADNNIKISFQVEPFSAPTLDQFRQIMTSLESIEDRFPGLLRAFPRGISLVVYKKPFFKDEHPQTVASYGKEIPGEILINGNYLQVGKNLTHEVGHMIQFEVLDNEVIEAYSEKFNGDEVLISLYTSIAVFYGAEPLEEEWAESFKNYVAQGSVYDVVQDHKSTIHQERLQVLVSLINDRLSDLNSRFQASR